MRATRFLHRSGTLATMSPGVQTVAAAYGTSPATATR
jgi:hypothetical protein